MRKLYLKRCSLCMAAILISLFSLSCSRNINKLNLSKGDDLSAWNFFLDPSSKANPADVFSIKDGVIKISGLPFGYMYTKSKFSNFKLTLEWKYPANPSNSGIFLFVQNPNLWPNAVECQLKSGNAGDFVLLGGSNISQYKLKEGEKRPEFPVVKKYKPSNEKPVGQWNSAEILCRDGDIKVFINGELQNEASDSLHKIGAIALQSEGGEIWFRKVFVQSLE